MVWLWVSLLPIENCMRLIPNLDCARRPFHAALGIATCRMLIHLRKFASGNLEFGPNDYSFPALEVDPLEFAPLRHPLGQPPLDV